jgi:probable rRNA maturation factor
LSILVRYHIQGRPLSRAWVRDLSRLVLRETRGRAFAEHCELSVVLAGDGLVRSLNRDHRGKDRTTDVLSFPLLEGHRLQAGPGEPLVLGDVVLSLPQARRQARGHGRTFRAEAALLLTHGILHLLGYDHGTKAQEKRMFGLQDSLLRKWKAAGR